MYQNRRSPLCRVTGLNRGSATITKQEANMSNVLNLQKLQAEKSVNERLSLSITSCDSLSCNGHAN